MKALLLFLIPIVLATSEEKSYIERYNECFQKMIDQETTDKNFMKTCVGKKPDKAGGQKLSSKPIIIRKTSKSDSNLLRSELQKNKRIYRCVMSYQEEAEDLGIKSDGSITFAAVFEKGKVSNTKILKTTIKDRALVRCLHKETAKGRIKSQNPETPLKITFTLTKRKVKTIVTADYNAQRISKSSIIDTMCESSNELNKCQNKGNLKVLQYSILKNGKIHHNVSAPACLIEILGKIKFPVSKSATPVMVKDFLTPSKLKQN